VTKSPWEVSSTHSSKLLVRLGRKQVKSINSSSSNYTSSSKYTSSLHHNSDSSSLADVFQGHDQDLMACRCSPSIRLSQEIWNQFLRNSIYSRSKIS
jgi:hypothetical protein